ncbi:MAG: hypothetical protein ACFFAH_03320 [Promethearchaeota archaeon]
MALVEEKKASQKRRKKKWVRVSPDEMIHKYSDILRAYWHDGPVEHLLDRFFVNVHTGKIKIR